MADNEQASEPAENIEDSAITADEEHTAEENNAEQHLVDEETAVNGNNIPGDSGGGGEEAKEQAPAEAPADDQNAEADEKADENISDEQNHQTEIDRKSSQEEEMTEEQPEEIQDENAYDQDDAIAAVEAAQIENNSESTEPKLAEEPSSEQKVSKPSTPVDVDGSAKVESKPTSPLDNSMHTPQDISKPKTPVGQPQTESKQGSPAPGSAAGSKPGTPAPGSTTGSKPGTPAQGSRAGSKPGTPAPGSAAGSKPGTPAQGSRAGSKPGTPAPGSTAGSKPGTPAPGSTAGSKPGTPAPGSAAGSKPGTPTPGSTAGSKPGTPTPGSITGSKPGTPTPGSRVGSKHGTPGPDSAAGSKHGTPATGSTAGSKPGTPAPGSAAGSKPGTPAPGSRAGSKPGTSAPDSAVGSKRATPAPGSRPGSRIDGDATGTAEEEVKAESPNQQGKSGSRVTSGKGAGSERSRPASKGYRSGTPQQAQQERPSSKTGSPKASGFQEQTQDISRPGSMGSSGNVPLQAPTPSAVALPEESNIPSAPPPPVPAGMSHIPPSSEERTSSSALNMIWSFGMNKHVPVLNLTDEARKMIMYSCAHTGVLYDIVNNKQTLLQGHGNPISCTCCSADKRWLATADKGRDSMIIVWDTYTGIPVRTIFDANPDGGVVAIAMTPDAKYLATLSCGETQMLSIWDWTVEAEVPLCTAELNPSYGVQNYLLFNQEDTTQLVSNSESQVIFYSWEGGKIEYFAPPLTDEDFNKPVGRYSQSIFLSNSTRALTATSYGNLVVWDTNKPLTKVVSTEITPDKKALKLVRLQDRGLNVLTTTDKSIVTGDQLGHIKFFDQTLKLTNWYQDFHLGPVNSVSFAHVPDFDETANKDYPRDATINARKFAIRDFVVGTSNAVFAHVSTDGTDVTVIHRDHDAAVHGLATHPNQPWVAIGSYSGLLKIWDYKEKRPLFQRTFEQGQMIRCCAFDPEGKYIALGFTNGTVRILESLSLRDVCSTPFRYARDAITHVTFSHDSKYLATADAEYTTTVFVASTGQNSSGDPWLYLGRYRAHYKLILDIMFTVQLDSDQPKLLSVGMDRTLVEYDLEHSGQDDLKIAAWDRIEQSATPLCTAMYPPITKESFLVTANDQFKFKMYNSTTKMCRKTVLGPTYGSPVQKMVVLPTADVVKDKRYLAYITSDKVGLHILPLDGNPHNAMALLAHPQGVANLAVSHDGKHVFTAGGTDATVHMWDVNLTALEAQARLGGEGLIPFYGLLDGGRDGELFKELEDYFYYAQIRSQGVDTMDGRNVSTTIALSEVPYVMRAMGFYPSEQEIEDMLNEVKYSSYVETGKYTSEIDLGDFIKLYTNHRPAFGLQADKLAMAFELLGFNTDAGMAIDRGDLLDFLQSKGEHMTEYELAEYLTTLLGHNAEGGNCEQQEFDPSTAGDVIDENLPQEITANMFSNELLGFSMYNHPIGMEDVQLQERSPSEVQMER